MEVTRLVNGVKVSQNDLKNYTITNEILIMNIMKARKELMKGSDSYDSKIKYK